MNTGNPNDETNVPDPPPESGRIISNTPAQVHAPVLEEMTDHEVTTSGICGDGFSLPPTGYGPSCRPLGMANRPVGLSPTTEEVKTLASTPNSTTDGEGCNTMSTMLTDSPTLASIANPYLGFLRESQ